MSNNKEKTFKDIETFSKMLKNREKILKIWKIVENVEKRGKNR